MNGETKQKSYCPQCGEAFDAKINVCPRDGARLFAYRLRDTEPLDPLVGEVLDGRFRLDAMLGQGGMGAVYRGVQLSVDRKVAIKVLKPDLSNEEVIIQRFFREARVISELAHPGIVNLIDFGQDATRDVLYLVMELVDGWELGNLLRRGRLQLDAALDVISQVCSALSEPHARGIVHRDLKPDNMMLMALADGTVRVKVLDFGIASALQLDTKITSTGMICGTAHYMSPEQAQARDIGPATDIYALGVVLFELLSGQLPFEAESALQILLKHVQVTPPSLREFVSPDEVPDRVVDLVDRMLAKDPAHRPESVVAIRDEIEAIARAYDLRAVRIDTTGRKEELLDGLLVLGPARKVALTSEQLRVGTDHGRRPTRQTGEELALMATHPSAPAVPAATVQPAVIEPISVPSMPVSTDMEPTAMPSAPDMPDMPGSGQALKLLAVLMGLVVLMGVVVVVLLMNKTNDVAAEAEVVLEVEEVLEPEPEAVVAEEAPEPEAVVVEEVPEPEVMPEVMPDPEVVVEKAPAPAPPPTKVKTTAPREKKAPESKPQASQEKPGTSEDPDDGSFTIFGLE